MDDVVDFLDATAGDDTPDAAATPDAAGEDAPDLFELLLNGGEPPAHDAAPDDGEPDEADPLQAEGDPYAADADDADEDEPETLEARIERLEAEKAEFLQAKRDAEAKATEAETRDYWQRKAATVEGRKEQAIEWLVQEAEKRGYDGLQWAMGELPRVIASYSAELMAFKDEQIQAVWEVARKHGSQTYKQSLQQQFELSDAQMQRISKYPPEMWQDLATDYAETQEREVAPVKRELTTTKGQLTKAQRANSRTRQSQMPVPGSGRSTVIDMAKARKAITPDNADDIAGRLFDAIGLFG